jgi:hypothetical protein
VPALCSKNRRTSSVEDRIAVFRGLSSHHKALKCCEILDSLYSEDQIYQVEVRTQAEAEAIRFVGSPSIALMALTLSRGQGPRKTWFELSHLP